MNERTGQWLRAVDVVIGIRSRLHLVLVGCCVVVQEEPDHIYMCVDVGVDVNVNDEIIMDVQQHIRTSK